MESANLNSQFRRIGLDERFDPYRIGCFGQRPDTDPASLLGLARLLGLAGLLGLLRSDLRSTPDRAHDGAHDQAHGRHENHRDAPDVSQETCAELPKCFYPPSSCPRIG